MYRYMCVQVITVAKIHFFVLTLGSRHWKLHVPALPFVTLIEPRH